MRNITLVAFCVSLTVAASFPVLAAGDDVNDANVNQRDNSNLSGPQPATADDQHRDVAPNATAPSDEVNDANVRNRENANINGASSAGQTRDPDSPPAAASSPDVNDASVNQRDNSNVNAPR